jgi:hypothetical protein
MVYTPQGNTGIDPSLTRWPASGAYSLNEWPSAINVGASGPLGSKCTPCPASTLPRVAALLPPPPLTPRCSHPGRH